jgi:hypothetical protein
MDGFDGPDGGGGEVSNGPCKYIIIQSIFEDVKR